jgi:hypothetical protein
MATEEHGGGKQMLRFRVWPKWTRFTLLPLILFAGISLASASDGAWLVSVVCAALSILIVTRTLFESAAAYGVVSGGLRKLGAS